MDSYSSGAFDQEVYDPYPSAGSAAISVAVLIVVTTLILAAMKKSGFRAMVAVGRT